MFDFEKPSSGRVKRHRSMISQGGTPIEAMEEFPRLGSVPIQREKTLVEEIFSFDGPPDATVSVGGQDYYYFSGEGYLGLQANPEVLAATCEAVLRYGTSLGTSRRRYTPAPIFEVERQTAEIYRTDAALYALNETLAAELLLESVAGTFERVFIDELSGDAAFAAAKRAQAASGREPVAFRHRDAQALNETIRKNLKPNERPLVITDGVFNVTGTIAPLPDYYDVLSRFDESLLLLDDSDSLGILGERGRGTLEYFDYDSAAVNQTRQDRSGDPTLGLDYWPPAESLSDPSREAGGFGDDLFDDEPELPETDKLDDDFIFLEPETRKKTPLRTPPVRTCLFTSLARAIGGFGAVIPGSELFIARLRDTSRPVHMTALPPTPMAAATVKGLQLSFHHDVIRQRLWNNVWYFKSELKKLGLAVEENMAPIVALTVGSDQNMRRIQRELLEEQILISFLQQMSARRSQGSLRIALFATHQRVMLDLFLETLARAL